MWHEPVSSNVTWASLTGTNWIDLTVTWEKKSSKILTTSWRLRSEDIADKSIAMVFRKFARTMMAGEKKHTWKRSKPEGKPRYGAHLKPSSYATVCEWYLHTKVEKGRKVTFQNVPTPTSDPMKRETKRPALPQWSRCALARQTWPLNASGKFFIFKGNGQALSEVCNACQTFQL